jgi:putative DNA primase/helicase
LATRYGIKALDDECRKIEEAQPGTQEVTLNTSSFVIGTLVGGGEVSMTIARAALIASGMKIARGWSLEDVAQKVERALIAGQKQPRKAPQLPLRAAGFRRPSPVEQTGDNYHAEQSKPSQPASLAAETAPTPVTEREVRAAMAKAAEPADDEPFEIQLRGGGLSDEATLGERAIIRAGHPIYQRGRTLVQPVVEDVDAAHGRRTKVAQLVEIDRYALVDYLCRSATFTRYDGRIEQLKRVNPPLELASVIASRQGAWKFPSIIGVITTPTLRPDGSLLTEAGYDPVTRLLLVDPPRLPPIPDAPTKVDAAAALQRLKYLLNEFPLASPASASVALSALITPIVRAAFPVAPLHVMSAPTPGTGKSFLLDVAAAIAIGRLMPVMAAGRTEEETEKRLASALLAGQPLISIDNVNGDLGGDALNQAIERPVIDIRPLGRSERITVESRSTLFATGNNIRLLGDMTRRVIVATLDTEMERPELRQFTFNPVKTVLGNRGRYIADVLIICRAYIAAGRPEPAPALGSFEGWSDLVRSALLWLGEADPVETMEKAREEDPYLANLRTVFAALRNTVGLDRPKSTAELISLAEETLNGTLMNAELRDALSVVSAERNGRLNPRLLGHWLRRNKGRVDAGYRLEGRSASRADWWLSKVVPVVAASSSSEK